MSRSATRRAASDWTAAMRDAADITTVLAVRAPLLWLEAPTALQKREQTRMGAEKVEAAYAGMAAAGWEMWRWWMTAWMAPLSARATSEAMNRTARAAYAPARKTLRANARRLKARTSV